MGDKPPKLGANAPITPSGEPSIGSGNLSTLEIHLVVLLETRSL